MEIFSREATFLCTWINRTFPPCSFIFLSAISSPLSPLLSQNSTSDISTTSVSTLGLQSRRNSPLSVAATVDNGTFVWTFSGLAPGATEVVNLTVEVGEGVAPGTIIPNVFEATYTNSAGSVLGRVRSTPVTVTVAADYSAFLWIGLGAVVFALLAAGLLRWKKVDIEDVFLVYRDGVLISHLSRTLLREKDEDVLSGMLTAVQEFVREAFQYGEHRDLHQMDFGDYRILIERGRYVFLAVVYSGKESLALRKKVRSVIERVEGQFGAALESWDGDMERVMGARDLVRDTLLGSANHNHAARASAESE